MERIRTSKGNDYQADFVYLHPLEDTLTIRLIDERRIPEIASEFDQLDSIILLDHDDYEYTTYTKIAGISSRKGGRTDIMLVKEA